MKILIDKEKLEARIAELEEQYFKIKHKKEFQLDAEFLDGARTHLKEILHQGEEYNENEAIEFAEWIGSFISLEFFNGIKEWEESNGKIIKRHTTQELFKLYKNARDTKKKK